MNNRQHAARAAYHISQALYSLSETLRELRSLSRTGDHHHDCAVENCQHAAMAAEVATADALDALANYSKDSN